MHQHACDLDQQKLLYPSDSRELFGKAHNIAYIEAHPAIFRVYSLEDLMARKFVALYNRMEGKDIYDLFYCLDLDFDKENRLKALNLMLDFYRIDQPDFPDELLLRLRDARKNSYYIGNSANHFIPRDLRPDWEVFIDTLILKIEKTLRGSGEHELRVIIP